MIMQSIRFNRGQLRSTLLTALMILSTAFSGCGDRIPEQKKPLVPRTPAGTAIIADTVTYNVIVKNPEPDDTWTEKALGRLDMETLVDMIFEAIYNREMVPRDDYSNEAMSVRDIRRLEQSEEFSRANIGQLQFTEEWYFDEENLRLEKRVNSITLGYEIYNLAGELRGYKAAFKINLN